MRLHHLLGSAALALLLFVQAGCGGSGGMSEVTGTVTLDDKLLESGAISFIPVDGQSTTAGGEIKQGHYSVQVPPVAMKVSISSPKVVGKKKLYDTPDSPTMDVTQEAVPAKYNEQTELQIDVKSGANKQDFKLQSK